MRFTSYIPALDVLTIQLEPAVKTKSTPFFSVRLSVINDRVICDQPARIPNPCRFTCSISNVVVKEPSVIPDHKFPTAKIDKNLIFGFP